MQPALCIQLLAIVPITLVLATADPAELITAPSASHMTTASIFLYHIAAIRVWTQLRVE